MYQIKPAIGINSTKIYLPLLPMSCIRLKIREIDGSSSIKPNNAKSIIIITLNVFIAVSNPVSAYASKPIRINIIMALGKTPNQNSLTNVR